MTALMDKRRIREGDCPHDRLEQAERVVSKGKGGFKNIKLGKNVYRQLKRRGPPQPNPDRSHKPDRGDQGNRQKSGACDQ